MAWNDSSGSNGGSGNRNPWGKRPQSGPPDLDDMIRNFKRRLSGLFGGDGGEPRAPGGNGSGGAGVGIILGVLLLVWALTGFYQNDQAERSVILRFGKFSQITQPGWNWRIPWPVDSRIVVNIERIESFNDQTRMLTTDENMIDINIAVQYRRNDPKQFALNVLDPEDTLREVSESAIRETVGRSSLLQVLGEGRQDIAARTKDLIQRTLSSYKTGIEITSVNLQGVSIPEQVAQAQQDAIKAGKDKERLVLEAQTYANDILPKARGAQARDIQEAQAYRARKIADSEGEAQRFLKLLTEYERAPAVTRQRLYLETMQTVLGNSKKVVIDTKAGGNMFYLPIDKLIEQSRGTVRELPRDTIAVTRAPAEAPAEERRSRGAR
jgi:modulator of FtsH protease HflK